MSLFRFFKGTPKKSVSQQGYHDPRFSTHEPQFSQGQFAHPQSAPQYAPQQQYPQQQYPQQVYPQSQQDMYGHAQQGPQLHTNSAPQMRTPSFNMGGQAPQTHPHAQQHSLFPQQPQFGQQTQAQQASFFGPQPANNGQQQSSSDLRDLRFWDSASSGDEDYPEDEGEEGENQPLKFVFALGILIIFAALAWLVFKWSTQSVTNVAPHIQAEQTPYKIRPDNPGGMQIPHQDKLVYGKLGHDAHLPQEAQGEHILPPPEQVMQPTYGAPQQLQGQPQYPQQQPYQGQVPQQIPQGQMQGQAPQGYVQPQFAQPSMTAPQNQQQLQQQGYPQQQAPQQASQAVGQVPAHPFTQQAGHPNVAVPPGAPQYADEDGEQIDQEHGQFYPNNIGQQQPTVAAPAPQPQIDQTQVAQPQQSLQNPSAQNPSVEIENIIENAATGYLPAAPATKPQAGQVLYKARLASLPNKKAAEQEWERLKKNHSVLFKGLNKSIQEQTVGGKKYHVLSVLGLPNEAKAKEFCKKLGCTYTKQQ